MAAGAAHPAGPPPEPAEDRMSRAVPGTGATLVELGERDVQPATPPPTETIESAEADVATVQDRVSR